MNKPTVTTMSRRRLLALAGAAAVALATPYLLPVLEAKADAYVTHPDGTVLGRFDDHWFPVTLA